jgi:hypothetical protein
LSFEDLKLGRHHLELLRRFRQRQVAANFRQLRLERQLRGLLRALFLRPRVFSRLLSRQVG